MGKKDFLSEDDYIIIADEIVEILAKHGATYRNAEDILKYVSGALLRQEVQSF